MDERRVTRLITNLAATLLGFGTPFAVLGIWRYCRQKFTDRGIGSDIGRPKITGSGIVPTRVKEYELWNTAIFFPCPVGDGDPGTSINKLRFYLNQAEISIKLCIMTFCYRPIYDLLIQKHQQGIQVLLFTSYSTANGKGKRLRAKGIPVRSLAKGNYSTEMHNKYVIIDDEAVLTGSMNWTLVSIHQQRENILITTDYRIVPKCVEHFDVMWTNFWDENVDVEGNRLDED